MSQRPIIRYDDLNPVEKAVYLTGAVASGVTWILESLLSRTADVIVDAEKAFWQGRDPNVEDAKYHDLPG